MKLTIVFLHFMIIALGVLSKDLSESERANRAAFIQRLLNKDKYLEGRIKLIGGPSRFEGKIIILGSLFICFYEITITKATNGRNQGFIHEII